MPRALRVFQVDAFTTQPFCGNPAGVVLDADTLSGEAMQLIARELNNGDTAFVLRADGDDHDIRVRFFTPRTEVSFVGHASIAVHAVLARVLAAPAPRQKQRSGIVNVQVQGADTTLNVAIAQPPPRLQQAPPAAALAATLTALGLNSSELDQRAPPIIAGEASTRLLLALNEGSRLAQLQPDSAQLAALSPLVGAPGYFLYSLRPAVADCEVEARMFCPALGIAEDPVSGNAPWHAGRVFVAASAAASRWRCP
jgi:PhzF family phenazine biosynthesis protein